MSVLTFPKLSLGLHLQGDQRRDFNYNSLSRLLSAENPESGIISYQYDDNGNLTSKTDARPITTSYVYDALNRITQRSYSDTTPNVSYTYKATAPALGSLIKVESSVSTTEYTGFDILGRVTGHKQTTDGQDYTTSYVYNLSGGLVEQTYPSGRKVKNVTDQNGYLSMVQSAKCMDASLATNANCTSQAGLSNYASSFSYNAVGAVTSMQLGNGKWESTQFNGRLQPTQIALGATNGASNFLKLDYGYGGTNNNGNVVNQTITVPTVGITPGFTAEQTYTYDSLNRILAAEETISSTQTWKQAFTYDRYGNRNFDEEETTTLLKQCGTSPNFTVCAADRKIFNPSADVTNNRLSSDDDYTFDASGNTINDPQGRTFIYDAENKQVEVKDDLNQTIGKYWYDGDGKRIKKNVPATGETTVFVYDAAGKLIADYSTEFAPDPKVSYTTSDHLGSPRILTDENGEIISRRDFHPFGEEVATTERVSVLGYQTDDIRQKFTTYERDNETEMDYAQARMYAKNLGRFNSADEPFFDQYEDNPQSWNLYLYVRNNPLNLVDPFGTAADCPPHAGEGCYERDGKYYIKDEEGNEIEFDPTIVTVDSSAERDSDSPVTSLTRAPRGRRTNYFERPFRDAISWGRELWRRWTGRSPSPPQTQPNPPASQPNQPVYGPPSPPPMTLRQQILELGRRIRGRFPKRSNPNDTLYRTDANGNITHYQTYDSSGRPIKRVDLTGRPHGGIPTPHVREYDLNVNPSGQTFVNPGTTRPARPSEIP